MNWQSFQRLQLLRKSLAGTRTSSPEKLLPPGDSLVHCLIQSLFPLQRIPGRSNKTKRHNAH